jgi:hypothetical protein
MWDILTDTARLLAFLNELVLSTIVILSFSLLAYILTYNFRVSVARRFALLLACVMVVYASEVAVTRVVTAASAERWLRFEWLGIALMPAAYYLFSNAVLSTTNFPIGRRRWIGALFLGISLAFAVDALFGSAIVDGVYYSRLVAHLDAGPFFGLFAVFFGVAVLLSLGNILKARSRCLTAGTRRRMNYLLLGFIAPGVGVFPYLIAMSRLNASGEPSLALFVFSLLGNIVVGVMLVIMSYTVSYFGVLTPDRVVRYRMVRFFMRGPVVAILVVLAVLTAPVIERWLVLPRNVVLFSVITGVIIFSQLFLSVSKSFVDRIIYREDRDEIAWLRELDRRLLATSDLRQFLENNLAALCELLRVSTGFVVGVSGSDLVLESMVGPVYRRSELLEIDDWGNALEKAPKQDLTLTPHSHHGFWLWTLQGRADEQENLVTVGLLGVEARTSAPLFSQDESILLERFIERITSALVDRRLQQSVFITLRTIIPDIERIQHMRNLAPYARTESGTSSAAALLDSSPIDNPEFEAWVKDALSHYWGGPKLAYSPLIELRVVNEALTTADDDPTKALRLVLGNALRRLRPDGKQSFTAPEWLLYNILDLRFVQGRKVREIADRLAMSESDLYRKQRVAIGRLAQTLSDMEQENAQAGASGRGTNNGAQSGESKFPGADDEGQGETLYGRRKIVSQAPR